MWIDRRIYDHLIARVAALEEQLALESAENRRAERHWANMFQRRMQTFPLADKSEPTVTAPVTDTPTAPYIDEGELAAMIEAGKAYGVPPAEVEQMLKREKGIA